MGIIDWFKKPAQKRFDQAIPEIKISITHSTTPSSERISRSELIAKSKDALSASKLEDIGNTDPICPNCSQVLERMPHRKTKCPSCGSFIYVRTRPSDRKKVLVSGSQVLLIEEQCAEQSAIIYGYHETYLAKRREFDKEKAAMDEKFGRDIPYGDVKLSIYNQELLEHASNNNWGLYRNTKLQMAEVLELEDSPRDALRLYLEICYLDINGPTNIGSAIKYPELLKEYPPFDPKRGLFAPGILKRISRIKKELGLDSAEIKKLFYDSNKEQQDALKLSRSIEDAWVMLEKEL